LVFLCAFAPWREALLLSRWEKAFREMAERGGDALLDDVPPSWSE
jgi:hypothetical protein